MGSNLMEKLQWQMSKWLWAPPEGIALDGPGMAEWERPGGKPVKKKRWHVNRKGRGSKEEAPEQIREFYHRGAFSRHEIRARHKPKAVMSFRGKGSKVERRSTRSIVRRKRSGSD